MLQVRLWLFGCFVGVVMSTTDVTAGTQQGTAVWAYSTTFIVGIETSALLQA